MTDVAEQLRVEEGTTVELEFPGAHGQAPHREKYRMIAEPDWDRKSGTLGINSWWGSLLKGRTGGDVVTLPVGDGNVADATIVSVAK